jgi:hypothetical protein
MGFVADKAVEPLDWDFSKYGAGSGTSPEPSTAEIERFNRKWRALVQALLAMRNAAITAETSETEEMSPEQAKQKLLEYQGISLDDALQRLSSELDDETLPGVDEVITHMAQLIAEVAKDQPSVDQIMALPHRPRTAFFGWFVGEMTNPESEAAGMKPSLSLVHSG